MLSRALPAAVVETVHGVAVSDPYRWLENRSSSKTEEWLTAQRARFESYIGQIESLEVLGDRIREVLDQERVDEVGRVGDRLFYRRRGVGKEQPSIFVMDMPDGRERLLVDPSDQGPYTTASIHSVSSDGSLMSYHVKFGGEHTKAIHIVEVANGRTIPDHLENGLGRGFVFRDAGDGFYSCHEPATIDSVDIGSHAVVLHRFKTAITADEHLLTLPRTGLSKVILKGEGGLLGAVYAHEKDGVLLIDFYVAEQRCDHLWRCVCQDVPSPFVPFFHRGRLFAHSFSNKRNGEIVELDRETGKPYRVVVPEWIVQTNQTIAIRDRFLVSYLLGTETKVRIWSLEGHYLGDLPLEEGRSWTFAQNYSGEAQECFLQCESFTVPPEIFRYSIPNARMDAWKSNRASILRPTLAVTNLIYPASDGTQVCISLLGTNEMLEVGDRPLVMTAYGGFGVTLTPQFSAFVSVLLDLGFLFAIPQIRGGGERGREWHEAARARNRQVAFDDFIEAAEWLCARGYTTSERLAIVGGSNAGTLVGAVITQRPQLFRAAICIAPLLDMIRYHLFDRARLWANEYGTAEDPDDFRALYAYSPYHNVQQDTNYPAVLFVCGDRDIRCNPAHARKMAARLIDRSAQTNAILLDHSAVRGHAPTLPLSVRVTGIVHRIAFLCRELGVDVSG